MTRSIADAVAELKSSVLQALDPEEIQRACLEVGHAWRTRRFDPVTTILLFTLQIVHSNTACTHVMRLLPGVTGTDSGYCQARSRIPLAAFRNLFRRVTRRLLESVDHALDRWHGHRVFFLDGSSCSGDYVATSLFGQATIPPEAEFSGWAQLDDVTMVGGNETALVTVHMEATNLGELERMVSETTQQFPIDPTKHSSGRTTRAEMTVSGREGDVEVSYTRTVEAKEVWEHP